jgi:hypothetical protein
MYCITRASALSDAERLAIGLSPGTKQQAIGSRSGTRSVSTGVAGPLVTAESVSTETADEPVAPVWDVAPVVASTGGLTEELGDPESDRPMRSSNGAGDAPPHAPRSASPTRTTTLKLTPATIGDLSHSRIGGRSG